MIAPVGSPAPSFTLKDQHHQPVSLTDFRSRKAVLLVFYPLAFTGTCQGELTEIKNNPAAYATPDVQVVTVSVDSPPAHLAWAEREGFNFPLLADFWPHGEVARAYGVFDEPRGTAGRGTFLIDRTGVIRFAELSPPGTARDQKAWLTAIAALPPATVR